jgi:hypothetical protein
MKNRKRRHRLERQRRRLTPLDRKFRAWRAVQQRKACDLWLAERGLTHGYPVFAIEDVLWGNNLP